MAKFNAVLVNPKAMTVTSVVIDDEQKINEQIYKFIECDCFDVARINDKGDAFFVDDEGLLKGEADFFRYADYPHPLAGMALLLGCDSEGETIEATVKLDEVKAKVQFVTPVRINGDVVWLPSEVAA